MVLLKNDGVLPLAPETRVAVVGLLADECKLDWYSGTLIHRSTPLEGLYERFGADRVSFAEGVDRVRLRTADGRFLHVLPADDASAEAPGTEGALDPALLAGRTDLPPLTTDASAPNWRSSTGARACSRCARPTAGTCPSPRTASCAPPRPARGLGRAGDLPAGTP